MLGRLGGIPSGPFKGLVVKAKSYAKVDRLKTSKGFFKESLG